MSDDPKWGDPHKTCCQNYRCLDCGTGVGVYNCNGELDALFRTDYAARCENEACPNHVGVGFFSGDDLTSEATWVEEWE